MAIGGMEVFGHDYHFGAKPTYEGVSKSKGVPSHPTKGKKKGHGGPKSLKPHSEKHYSDSRSPKPGLKSVGNENRKPRDHKDIPTKAVAGGSKARSTANSSKKDSVWGGYGKGPQ